MKFAFLIFPLLFLIAPARAALILDGDAEAIRILKPYLPSDAKRSQYRLLANEILATEGYFSPTITFKRQENRDLKMTILLGERVKVGTVMIEITDENARSMTDAEKAPFLKEWKLPAGAYFKMIFGRAANKRF